MKPTPSLHYDIHFIIRIMATQGSHNPCITIDPVFLYCFSEIDKYAIANYRYNNPDAEYIGSVTDVHGRKGIDLITFGWPCQDNSIAGKRKGTVTGTRSGLLYEAVRIIGECKPGNFIAENVEGLRTVNKGIDIIEAIKVLAFLNARLPQYDIEVQLLNTSWFLPQNRERLYFVGHLRTGSVRRIFPIGESDCRNGITQTEEQGFGQRLRGNNNNSIAPTIRARYCKDGSDRLIKQVNKNKSWNGTETKQKDRVYSDTGIMATLGSHNPNDKMNIIVQRGRGFNNGGEKDISPTVSSNSFEHNNYVAVALTETRTEEAKKKRRQNMLTGRDYNSRRDKLLVKRKDNLMNTVTANYSKEHLMMINNNIRRLTEIECERLQGFPDNWTQYGIFEGIVKPISKTQRYKMCGNAVTVNVVKAIVQKMAA